MKLEQTWRLVNHIRSFAKKGSPPEPKEEKSKDLETLRLKGISA